MDNLKSEIGFLISIWEVTPNDTFCKILKKLGWKVLSPISFKKTFYKGDVVCKFDEDGEIGSGSHTGCEYLQYRKAKPHKKRYLAKVIAYRNGLLFQEKLDTFCSSHCSCNDSVRDIARRLRISDWLNHGYKDGKLKFVDTDSIGSGWWNWKRKKGKGR